MIKQFFFKKFNLALVICLLLMSNISVWPIDRSLSCSINPGQSGPRSDGNEGVPRASPSDCLMSVQDIHLGVLPICWDAVGLFYSPSQLGYIILISFRNCLDDWTFDYCWCLQSILADSFLNVVKVYKPKVENKQIRGSVVWSVFEIFYIG